MSFTQGKKVRLPDKDMRARPISQSFFIDCFKVGGESGRELTVPGVGIAGFEDVIIDVGECMEINKDRFTRIDVLKDGIYRVSAFASWTDDWYFAPGDPWYPGNGVGGTLEIIADAGDDLAHRNQHVLTSAAAEITAVSGSPELGTTVTLTIGLTPTDLFKLTTDHKILVVPMTRQMIPDSAPYVTFACERLADLPPDAFDAEDESAA